MGDATNVISGSGALYVAPFGTLLPSLLTIPAEADWITAGFEPTGYTDDGVEFISTPQFKDIDVDEEMSPIDKLLIGEKLEVQVKLAETTIQNLAMAMAGGTLEIGAGTSTLYLGSINPQNIKQWTLGFTGPAPLANGNQTRVIIVQKVMATAAVTFKYQRKDKMIYAVKFDALADSTQPAGQRLFRAIDYNSAGS